MKRGWFWVCRLLYSGDVLGLLLLLMWIGLRFGRIVRDFSVGNSCIIVFGGWFGSLYQC